MNNSRYTDDELYVCRNTDIVSVCETLGYHVKKSGHFCMLKEMDSLMIKNRKTFIRYSNDAHGSAIDFLMETQKLSWHEAVDWLLSFNGISRENHTMIKPTGIWFDVNRAADGSFDIEPVKSVKALHQAPVADEEEKPEFILPETTKPDRVKLYLTLERMLSEKLVDAVIRLGLVMEDKNHHNVLFVGKDSEGIPRHISVRGTYTLPGNKAYKSTVPGSDTAYSFNMIDKESDILAVFEAPIDALSFCDLRQLHGSFRGNYLALTGVHDKALEQFLTDHPGIKKIHLCLDQDEAGEMGCKKIFEKYTEGKWKERNLEFIREEIPDSCKDWNEYLVNERKKTIMKTGGIAL